MLVSSSPPAQLSNTASLTAASDGNPANNSFTDEGAVSEPAIDLHVEKVVTSTPNFTPVGYLFFLDAITYRIEVTNNGVADAANVQLTEILDAPLIVESITPSQGTCSVSPPDLQPRHDRRRPGAGHDRHTGKRGQPVLAGPHGPITRAASC